MFYKFNQVSSRLQQSEAALVQTSGQVAGEVTYIPPYQASTGLSFRPVNRVKAIQTAFGLTGGRAGQPVFLRGPRDVMLYRSVMVLSLGGISLALYAIYKMATGTMQKKAN